MPVIFQKWITRADLKANPKVLYAFGDNEIRVGLGGQAKEMRGEPNAVGVATLKAPGRFWNESEIVRQCAIISADFEPIFAALKKERTVVFPLDGIGTGLAALEIHSPSTFSHIQALIYAMKNYAPI